MGIPMVLKNPGDATSDFKVACSPGVGVYLSTAKEP